MDELVDWCVDGGMDEWGCGSALLICFETSAAWCARVCVCEMEDMLIYEGGRRWVGERIHRHDRYARPARGASRRVHVLPRAGQSPMRLYLSPPPASVSVSDHNETRARHYALANYVYSVAG